MRLLEIFGLMGITVKKGILDIYKHIFQGALSTTLTLMAQDTPLTWAKMKQAPSAFPCGGRRQREAESPGRGEPRENQGEDCLVPGCTSGFLLCVAHPSLHEAAQAVVFSASGLSLQQSHENQAQRYLGELT